MMNKILNGSDLAGFIKQRQGSAVRASRQSRSTTPKLAIVQLKDDPVIDTYVRLKKTYGSDIEAEVEVHRIAQSDARGTILKLNDDPLVHGIILQLPIEDPSETDELCNLVSPLKDVDALGDNAKFEPATPMAILWLLAGYNVELKGKKIVLVGNGKLVGKPLAKNLRNSGFDVTVADRSTVDLKDICLKADIIVTATGSPAIIYSEMLKPGAVVVDAGVASEEGKIVGDLADDVYERDDLVLTPVKGGVGPLTICALFENVITSATNFSQKLAE